MSSYVARMWSSGSCSVEEVILTRTSGIAEWLGGSTSSWQEAVRARECLDELGCTRVRRERLKMDRDEKILLSARLKIELKPPPRLRLLGGAEGFPIPRGLPRRRRAGRQEGAHGRDRTCFAARECILSARMSSSTSLGDGETGRRSEGKENGERGGKVGEQRQIFLTRQRGLVKPTKTKRVRQRLAEYS